MNKNYVFSERLNNAINKTNKSINLIERELGYPRNALQNYNNGAEPSGSRLIELAQYFKLTPEYLIGKTNKNLTISETNFYRLDEKQKMNILMLSLEWMHKIISSSQNK